MKKIFIYDSESVTFRNIRTRSYVKIGTYLLGIFIILFILGWFTGTNKYIINKITHKTEVTDTLMIHGEVFSEEALVNLMRNSNIKYPHIVFAQAKLESGGFKSKIFKQNHNMFGMRKAHQRITTARTEKDTYAFYESWTDCVYDYCMYQSSVMCSVSDEDGYFAKLAEKYAEDPMYVTKLKNIIN